jgi:hypothetical protein
MSISKAEAVRAATERDQALYDAFCARVDEVIRSTYGTGQKVTVYLAGVPRYIVDRVGQKYRDLDWTWQVVSDQRDGDYVLLD